MNVASKAYKFLLQKVQVRQRLAVSIVDL